MCLYMALFQMRSVYTKHTYCLSYGKDYQLNDFMTKNSDTHVVCEERLAREGGKATCCDCDPHEGCTINVPMTKSKQNKVFNDLPEKDQKKIIRGAMEHAKYLQDEVLGIPEWEKDLETEKLIIGKNQNSVLHNCPKHGTSGYMPLENKCPDCKLYLSGKDVRQLLADARREVIKEFDEWIKSWGSIPETNEYANGWNECRQELYRGYQRLLATLKEETP